MCCFNRLVYACDHVVLLTNPQNTGLCYAALDFGFIPGLSSAPAFCFPLHGDVDDANRIAVRYFDLENHCAECTQEQHYAIAAEIRSLQVGIDVLWEKCTELALYYNKSWVAKGSVPFLKNGWLKRFLTGMGTREFERLFFDDLEEAFRGTAHMLDALCKGAREMIPYVTEWVNGNVESVKQKFVVFMLTMEALEAGDLDLEELGSLGMALEGLVEKDDPEPESIEPAELEAFNFEKNGEDLPDVELVQNWIQGLSVSQDRDSTFVTIPLTPTAPKPVELAAPSRTPAPILGLEIHINDYTSDPGAEGFSPTNSWSSSPPPSSSSSTLPSTFHTQHPLRADREIKTVYSASICTPSPVLSTPYYTGFHPKAPDASKLPQPSGRILRVALRAGTIPDYEDGDEDEDSEVRTGKTIGAPRASQLPQPPARMLERIYTSRVARSTARSPSPGPNRLRQSDLSVGRKVELGTSASSVYGNPFSGLEAEVLPSSCPNSDSHFCSYLDCDDCDEDNDESNHPYESESAFPESTGTINPRRHSCSYLDCNCDDDDEDANHFAYGSESVFPDSPCIIPRHSLKMRLTRLRKSSPERVERVRRMLNITPPPSETPSPSPASASLSMLMSSFSGSEGGVKLGKRPWGQFDEDLVLDEKEVEGDWKGWI